MLYASDTSLPAKNIMGPRIRLYRRAAETVRSVLGTIRAAFLARLSHFHLAGPGRSES